MPSILSCLPNRRLDPWMALDAEKFDRWQPNLLALLNEPRLKRFVRWRMGLNRRVGRGDEILAIDPHHITVPLRGEQFQSSFSSQPAIQKALYLGFKPMFWGMHAYDWLLPDRTSQRWVQSLIRSMRPLFEGFGLSTLTAHPQLGGGGSNVTCDGYIERGSEWSGVDEAFDAIRSGAGTNCSVSDLYCILCWATSNTPGQFCDSCRIICTFDTSSIGSASSISAATFSANTLTPSSNDLGGTQQGNLVSASPAAANNLQNSDYGSLGASLWASGDLWGTGSLTLNSTGVAGINKTGITQLGLRSWWDLNDNFDGTWDYTQALHMIFCAADDVPYGPTLTVVYSKTNSQALPAGLASFGAAPLKKTSRAMGAGAATFGAAATKQGQKAATSGMATMAAARFVRVNKTQTAVGAAWSAVRSAQPGKAHNGTIAAWSAARSVKPAKTLTGTTAAWSAARSMQATRFLTGVVAVWSAVRSAQATKALTGAVAAWSVTRSAQPAKFLAGVVAALAGLVNKRAAPHLVGATATAAASVTESYPKKASLGGSVGDWNQKIIA